MRNASILSAILLLIASAPFSHAAFNPFSSGIIISNVTLAQNQILINSPVTLSLLVVNNGTSENSGVMLDVNVTGPLGANAAFNVNPLSPEQNESMQFGLRNVSEEPGDYNIKVSAFYPNGIMAFGSAMVNYTVMPLKGYPSYPLNETVSQSFQISHIVLSEAPIYNTQEYGTTELYTVILKNTASSYEVVNLTVPQQFSPLLKLSTNSIYMLPNTTISLSLLFTAPENLSSGTLVIPINFTVTASGVPKVARSAFFAFHIQGATTGPQPQVSRQIEIYNKTTSSVIYQIKNPSNETLSNLLLDTYLSSNIVGSISRIATAGVASNITSGSGLYVIHWAPGAIPAGETIYAYYTITSPSSLAYILNTSTVLTLTTPTSRSQVLQIQNPATPTLAQNSTGLINITGLYTGTRVPSIVDFVMTAPPGISLADPIQNLTVLPNRPIYQTFAVKSGDQSGTFTLTLYIATQGANYTYYLPLVVTPGTGSQTGTQRNSTSQNSSSSPRIPVYQLFLLIGSLALIGILAFFFRKKEGGARYNEQRAERLTRIKKVIERGD